VGEKKNRKVTADTVKLPIVRRKRKGDCLVKKKWKAIYRSSKWTKNLEKMKLKRKVMGRRAVGVTEGGYSLQCFILKRGSHGRYFKSMKKNRNHQRDEEEGRPDRGRFTFVWSVFKKRRRRRETK